MNSPNCTSIAIKASFRFFFFEAGLCEVNSSAVHLSASHTLNRLVVERCVIDELSLL